VRHFSLHFYNVTISSHNGQLTLHTDSHATDSVAVGKDNIRRQIQTTVQWNSSISENVRNRAHVLTHSFAQNDPYCDLPEYWPLLLGQSLYTYIAFLLFILLCPFCFLLPDFLVVFANVPSCFSWEASRDLKHENVISASIINLYDWVGVYVDFTYLMLMLWLCPTGVWCVVFVSFSSCGLPWIINICQHRGL
jgi:hypothetical protein